MYDNKENQPSFPDFKLPFNSRLSKDNRWVKLANLIPWEKIEQHYSKCFSKKGARSISARVAFGSLLIKQKEGLSDRETVTMISENPYMQYFLGYKEFLTELPFDASMMVHFRKRLSISNIEEVMEKVIEEYQESKKKVNNSAKKSKQDKYSQRQGKNKGQLIIDATCTPVDIKYPTDVHLLNRSREWLERIIKVLHEANGKVSKMPRTYKQKARKDFLSFAKKKSVGKKRIRKAVKKQLNYIRRDLKYITNFIQKDTEILKNLSKTEYSRLLVINEVYRQQLKMYRSRSNKIVHRIVSLSQPHIRPIIRGKSSANTEFGPKISANVVDGFIRINKYSYEPYNESKNFISHVEEYKERNDVYPESTHVDHIFRTRENRKYCKKHGIRISGPKLGRPKKNPSKEEKRLAREDEIKRIEIEGKFGVLKRKYSLDRIMPKLPHTSKVSVLMACFVLNIEKILKEIFFCLFFIYKFDLIYSNRKKYYKII